MRIDIITLFPDMFAGPFTDSIIARAQQKKKIHITIHNLRDWALTKHQTVDDKPFGGGVGMLLKCEPIFSAIESLSTENTGIKPYVLLMSAGGNTFSQKKAYSLSEKDWLILLAGHYEGVDQRVIDSLIDEEISIGDYILTGGEIPAMAIVDSVVRLLPGVLDKKEATEKESFSQKEMLLEYPQYTRPAIFKGIKVPEVLLSGNHKDIELWRKRESLKKTRLVRPDLLKER